MSEKLNLATILNLTEAAIKLIETIGDEIEKEKDAKKRNELKKTMDKIWADPADLSNLAALRKLLYEI